MALQDNVLVPTTAGAPTPGTLSSGALLNLNDAFSIAILGCQYATVRFKVVTAGTALFKSEVSYDNGVNWYGAFSNGGATTIACPAGKKVSAVSDNPTWTLFNGIALVANDIYEISLSAAVTNFRLRVSTAGTASTIQLTPGLPYVPGCPVTTTMFDFTTAINTALETNAMDLTGWAAAFYYIVTPAGGAGFLHTFDDAGVAIVLATVPASSATWVSCSDRPTLNDATTNAVAGHYGTLPFLRRPRVFMPAVAAVTNRARLELRR